MSSKKLLSEVNNEEMVLVEKLGDDKKPNKKKHNIEEFFFVHKVTISLLLMVLFQKEWKIKKSLLGGKSFLEI